MVEDAIIENLNTRAFDSKKDEYILNIIGFQICFLDYDVDWYGDNSTITNPFTLVNKQFLREEEVKIYN